MLVLQACMRYVFSMDDLSQLRRGAVELAVLLLLAGREIYGGELIEKLAAFPALAAPRGTVYPMLSRLRKAGIVETTWHESPVGPPRRYYRLTVAGEDVCKKRAEIWDELVRNVGHLQKMAQKEERSGKDEH